MSEDWKNERAEAAMREGTEAIRKAAEEKAKQEEIQKWDEIAESLYVGDSSTDSSIDFVLNEMRQKYHLPIKK